MGPSQRQIELARERETFRYDPTLISSSRPNSPTNLIPSNELTTSSDSILTAFCQIAALRLNTSRSLISLFDRSSQFVVAEATPCTSLKPTTRIKGVDQGLWLCGTHFPRSFGVCERAINSSDIRSLQVPQNSATEPPLTIISDLNDDDILCDRSYCLGWPHHRFYAGAPLVTPRGIVIGVLCVFDSEPRSGLDKTSEGILRDVAQSVIAHLEERRVSERYRQADRVTGGIRRFFHGRNTKTDMRNDRLLASEPRLRTPGTDFSPQFHSSSGNRHRGDRLVNTCATAADIMRDALEVEGLLLLDASSSHLSPGTNSGPNPPIDADSPCPVLSSSVTAEATQCADSYFGHSTLYASTLKKLLRYYPRGTIWNFDNAESDVSDCLSDDSCSDTSGDSTIAEEIDGPDELPPDAPPGPTFTPGQLESRQELRKEVFRLLPGATSVAFFPLWNAQKRRWFAGGFAYSNKTSRVFSPKRELSYLRALGSVLMAEVSFIKEREVELSKLDVLDSISHELRSPLHGIFFGAGILRSKDLSASQEDALLSIEACSRTLLDTIDQILDWSKINHFTSSLATSPDYTYTKVDNRALRISRNNSMEASMMSIATDADLPRLVEDVVESVHVGHEFQKLSFGQTEPSNSNKDPVRFVVHFEPGDNWRFHVQPGAIRRIVMNVLGNALRFTSSGSIYIKMEQSATDDPTVRLVKLIIADTGCGMTRDFLTNDLFSPFTQQNMMNAGTGLGLSIVRRITQALGGTVDVRSAVSVGTTVCISLPLKVSERTPHDTTESSSDQGVANDFVSCSASLVGLNDQADQRLRSPYLEGPLSEKDDLVSVCQDWLGMQVIQPPETQNAPHVVLCDDRSLEKARAVTQNDKSTPIVVICPNAVLARKAEKAKASHSENGGQRIYFTYQPIGPRKMARILSNAINRVSISLQPPLSRASSNNDVHDHIIPTIQQGPPTPPHLESANSAIMSDPFDHAIPTVPQQLPRSPLITPSERLDPISDNEPSSNTFLLVDDNPINLKMLIMFMKKLKLEYTTATDGRQAVEKYTMSPRSFRCIFMDISMPVMNGFEATRAIRASEYKMAERRSARLKAKADNPASAELSSQERKRTSKRKTPPPNNDKPVSKAPMKKSQSKESTDTLTSQQLKPKTGRATKKDGQPPVQAENITSNGPFSSLPPEAMNLVLSKIKDKASLGNLAKTCKAFHSLVMPRLYKRVEASVEYHAHIAKLIRSIEPALTIGQRKQLRKEGQYKGQQETFPKTDEKRRPEIANFIRQAAFEIGDPGQKHRFIVYRYIEELLKSAGNLQVFAATDFTESMAKSLASNNHLRALHLKISEGRMPDVLPLTAIKGLRHLHLETADVYTTADSPLALIWNSRSTLRSLTLDKSCFQRFYKNKMDRTEELDESSERRYDFTTLKSLSLQRVSWLMDPDEVDAVTRAIDFTALESLDLSHQSKRLSLLFRRLSSIFSSAESTKIKVQKLSLNMGYQAFTNRGDQTAKTEEEEPGLEFISSFDTLTSLTVYVHSADLPNPVLKDAMLQGILKHKNLSNLEFMNTYSIRDWDAPYLDANTVALLVDNLPRLRHFRFRSTAIHLSKIAKALSRGCNLETIRMEIPSASEGEAKELGIEFIHDLVFPILEKDSDGDEKVYRWEDHSKINQVILDVAVWEIGSEFGPFKKGMKKAQKITSSSYPKRKVMYRDVTRPTYLWMRTRFDDIRGWVDEVEKDIA
ncbi:uncharacterized protein FIESC28_10833 [Fusarium coffeatum]|uniref:histidine kinase n=1 Tax=Fusarium coffeatum TaxID=231269 RepID=A0A366QQG3_9HYPO|nr:uncharacterized protein FIESC28_10833 [Fusarium coffeatum]RBR07087.1 hypothetical protein FIESC28_10833 [Fusarium coffeatum]